MMKSLLFSILLVTLLLTSCASRRYTITLNSGNTITAYNKPRLENGHYVYKDDKGQVTYVTAGRVREIAPRGMATSRLDSGFSAKPIK